MFVTFKPRRPDDLHACTFVPFERTGLTYVFGSGSKLFIAEIMTIVTIFERAKRKKLIGSARYPRASTECAARTGLAGRKFCAQHVRY